MYSIRPAHEMVMVTTGRVVFLALTTTICLGCAPDLHVGTRDGSGGAGGQGESGQGGAGGQAPVGGTHVWSKGFGDTADQGGTSVATDGAGNIVVAGNLRGGADFGDGLLESAGGDDAFVAKLDPGGKVVFSTRFGDGNPQLAHAAAIAPGGEVLVGGEFSGAIDLGSGSWASAGGRDGFVARLGGNGAPMWLYQLGGVGFQAVTGVRTDAEGNVLLTGVFSGTTETEGSALVSAGGYDIVVAKLDAGGEPTWSRQIGDELDQRAHGIAVESDGSAVVVGDFTGTIGFGGTVLASAGGDDVFVMKLDQDGGPLWVRRFGDAGSQTGRCVAANGTGGVIVAGAFAGSIDFGGGPIAGAGVGGLFVVKLDGTGSHVWSKGFPYSGGGSQVGGLAVDGAGNVLLAGTLRESVDFGGVALTSEGDSDVFAVKLDAVGRVIWRKRFGGAGADHGASVEMDGMGNAVLVGDFDESIDFGGAALAGSGGADVFVAKLSQ